MDAIDGVSHFTDEVVITDVTLAPFSRWSVPASPHTLNGWITNHDPNATYRVVITKITDSVRMP